MEIGRKGWLGGGWHAATLPERSFTRGECFPTCGLVASERERRGCPTHCSPRVLPRPDVRKSRAEDHRDDRQYCIHRSRYSRGIRKFERRKRRYRIRTMTRWRGFKIFSLSHPLNLHIPAVAIYRIYMYIQVSYVEKRRKMFSSLSNSHLPNTRRPINLFPIESIYPFIQNIVTGICVCMSVDIYVSIDIQMICAR